MGESPLSWFFPSAEKLLAAAACVARRWRALAPPSLCVGLQGELGAGKTTWVRGMLRGLGYEGRVPSPTYTLVEPYQLEGIEAVHVDLYRLTSEGELEGLGLRDYLCSAHTWLLIEWPERHPALFESCDVKIGFELEKVGRTVTLAAGTEAGRRALEVLLDCDFDSSNES
jgi:tRNA threonylcarbamoyladenosine biosynthesis protein TsaE